MDSNETRRAYRRSSKMFVAELRPLQLPVREHPPATLRTAPEISPLALPDMRGPAI